MKSSQNLLKYFIVFLLSVLGGCSSHDVTDYRSLSPKFDLFSFFDGKSWGRGIVFNRAGKMTRQFIVEINGTFPNENRLLLDERFQWNNGEQTSRVWTIDRDKASVEPTYTGRAFDVRGEAGGRNAGNSFNWHYTLALEVDGTTWNIAFEDWMFLQEGNVLFNRAIDRKSVV
jgi:hypothetical protein